ncbi:C69 family dipeptidase [Phenylobacterium sp.]|uniref:C69 family dipeptidase n=1 Tax=Phenylobacterium sp. TaxID=1871053 RepID=UPI0012081214|nr:C69 family dipeptidase [Phenylobacterium sp.]THD58518.1 MAG: peptidase U34 [Phenylobacterium sp.]
MCDTLTAPARATAHGAALFAKNSDRERNEAQTLEMVPRRTGGGPLKLTYLTIEDAPATHGCLISRPFWMWGAEMGANEHGVAIGNEALHAKTPAQRKRALTGMDLVRLGLERAATAAEAVEVITGLLERHGQGGDCGHLGRFYYNNGFIIADPAEAYVLETAGRWWAVERVREPRALSNAYSIGRSYDAVSADLAAHARAAGWMGADGRFDVAGELLDEVRDRTSFGRGRCARGKALLDRVSPRLTPQAMMAILRDHGEDTDWTPARTHDRTICMHAAEGARRSQSVASMVSELKSRRAVHWVTATSAPCTGLFKPVLFETGLPPQGPAPGDTFDAATPWWRHERLHRGLLHDFQAGLAAIAGERNGLEAGFQARIDAAFDSGPAAMKAAVAACWREAEAAEARWLARLPARGPAGHGAHGRSWARLNHLAALPRT